MSLFPYLPGEWYVVITCATCKSRQPVIHDLTKGEANINAVYTWRCSECGHRGVYDGEGIELYQHPAIATAVNGSA